MSKKTNRRAKATSRRVSGDPRRRNLPTYSEDRATRHLLAFVGRHHWEEMQRSTVGARSEEDRRAIMLLVLLLGAVQPARKDVVTFRSDLLDTLAPLTPAELAQARSRLADAHGVAMTREGPTESWRLPLKVRALLAAFPMGALRGAWTATAADCQDALAMLALAAGEVGSDATATVNYTDLTGAAGRPVAEVLDLERFLVETGALLWAMPAGEGLTRWRLASTVLG